MPISPNLLVAAHDAAGGQDYPRGTLYLVPTPIGNLADITLRSLHVLALADAVACEDTRTSGALLRQYGISPPAMFALHQHNEQAASEKLVERLLQGERVALVSDAGSPAISDPGARAVIAARKAGCRVIPLPGASSVITAIEASGLAEGGFHFYGFLSTKAAERRETLRQLVDAGEAFVLLEAPHRIEALATELGAIAPQRDLTLGRELTKQFEQIVTLAAQELSAWLASDPSHRKGEFVCVVHGIPNGATEDTSGSHDDALRLALAELPTKTAVQLVATITGAPRNALYKRALELKNEP